MSLCASLRPKPREGVARPRQGREEVRRVSLVDHQVIRPALLPTASDANVIGGGPVSLARAAGSCVGRVWDLRHGDPFIRRAHIL